MQNLAPKLRQSFIISEYLDELQLASSFYFFSSKFQLPTLQFLQKVVWNAYFFE